MKYMVVIESPEGQIVKSEINRSETNCVWYNYISLR